MKMKKLCSALIALGLTFGAAAADISTADAASVSEIAAINVVKSGAKFTFP